MVDLKLKSAFMIRGRRRFLTLSKLQALILTFVLSVEIAFISFFLWDGRKPVLFLSPLPEKPISLPPAVLAPEPKEVYGFFPYWTSREEVNFHYHLLTHLAYFSLGIDGSGEIRKVDEEGRRELSWHRLIGPDFSSASRKVKTAGGKIVLVVTALDNELVASVVNHSRHRQKAIEEIASTVESKNVDGINLNLEYAGEPPPVLIRNFTTFVRELKETLPSSVELSIDVFADSARKVRIFDIPELAKVVDRIIIMGYDFHRPASAKAGPIAPIRGGPEKYEQNLSWALAAFLEVVPPEKIILGVPYYGYEWQTLSGQPNSMAVPDTGDTATYKRVKDKIAEEGLEPAWDLVALSPYLIFKQGGAWHQIYYEDETSLAYKYQLVHDLGLGGVAIWALGYDGNYPQLWDLLEEKFGEK